MLDNGIANLYYNDSISFYNSSQVMGISKATATPEMVLPYGGTNFPDILGGAGQSTHSRGLSN
jgi:hypothetical protein